MEQQPAEPTKGRSRAAWSWLAIVGGAFAVFVIANYGVTASWLVDLDTEPYKTALSRARSDPRVIAALGTPISTGSVHRVKEVSTVRELDITLRGPKQKATFRITARRMGLKHRKPAFFWRYGTLLVMPNTGPAIEIARKPDVP